MNLKEKMPKNQNLKRNKITMKNLKKQVKGITLIALVVTVIVLLILAGVALSLTIGDNGLFRRAEQATNTWRNAETNEQLAMEEVLDWMDGYLNGDGKDEDEGNPLKEITGNETKNTITQDKFGNPITIPAGFKVVNPNDDVTKGIVIEDVTAGGENSTTIGSQFVWIPVGEVITDSNGSTTTITLGRYYFNSDGSTTTVSSRYTEDTAESHNSSYGNAIAKDINDFIEKANSSGGYYIGRYEAGDATATSSRRTDSSSDTNPIVSKAGVYPYNYITQPQASSLCQGMYSSSNFESDLINSYAWDTAIVFIQEFSGDTDYSRQTRLQRSLAKCGEAHTGEEYDVRCNIYDMAGNIEELSTETCSDTYYPCISRGGNYYDIGYYTCTRIFSKTTDSDDYGSARPTLYL